MDSFDSFVDYFQSIATDHLGINAFVVGGVTEILALERASLTYPCLWLEYPSLTPIFQAGRSNEMRYHSAFSILTNAEVNDFEEERVILQDNLQIMHDILGRIYRDWNASKTLRLDPTSIQIDVLNAQANNNAHGWRMEFASTCMIPICYDPLKWA
ncbi:MAG TPA: hypothetical protein VHS96_04755 [Bacteroidia bacterium]|nr:hypothetical protein [Bacteroidia bacterium]